MCHLYLYVSFLGKYMGVREAFPPLSLCWMFSLHLQFMNQTRQGMGMKMDNMGGTPGMRPGMQPGMGGQVADKNASHHRN